MRRNAHALALDLEARGTKVILFQLPVAREIFNQVRQQNNRRIMREEVGEHTNLQMDLAMNESELRWTDGAVLVWAGFFVLIFVDGRCYDIPAA